MTGVTVTAREIATMLDASDDLDDVVAWAEGPNAPSAPTRRIQAELPGWIVEALNRRAERLGISRDALLRTWISERLQ